MKIASLFLVAILLVIAHTVASQKALKNDKKETLDLTPSCDSADVRLKMIELCGSFNCETNYYSGRCSNCTGGPGKSPSTILCYHDTLSGASENIIVKNIRPNSLIKSLTYYASGFGLTCDQYYQVRAVNSIAGTGVLQPSRFSSKYWNTWTVEIPQNWKSANLTVYPVTLGGLCNPTITALTQIQTSSDTLPPVCCAVSVGGVKLWCPNCDFGSLTPGTCSCKDGSPCSTRCLS